MAKPSRIKRFGESSWPPPFPKPPKRTLENSEFTTRQPIAWTTDVAFRDGTTVLGGSPWKVQLLPETVRSFAQKLFAAGRAGITAETDQEQLAATYLLDRGIADPLPIIDREVDDVTIVIPVYGDPGPLENCLASLRVEGMPVIVVDDASPEPYASAIRDVTREHGARLIVREKNGGPGGARNTGFEAADTPFVAFIDADALASPDWISQLRPLFDDARVGALGPRVVPDVQGTTTIELYEETRSELDMGTLPSLILYGAAVGWLPTASVMVRKAAVTDPPFEPGMRVGEDVDLFWRMDEEGWSVRYVPDVINRHEVRRSLKEFSYRRAMYGGSAAPLEKRHPRRLIPAQPSLSGLGIMAAIGFRKPGIAAAIGVYEIARHRKMLDREITFPVVAEAAAKSIWSDAFWTGHVLRRDWWPIGLIVMLLTPKSRLARVIAAAMLWQPVRDHLIRPTRLDPIRSLALRWLDDTSYGTGVIRGAIKNRVLNVVFPRARVPKWPSDSDR